MTTQVGGWFKDPSLSQLPQSPHWSPRRWGDFCCILILPGVYGSSGNLCGRLSMPVYTTSDSEKAVEKALSAKTKNRILGRGGAANRKAANVGEQPRGKKNKAAARRNAEVSRKVSLAQGAHRALGNFLQQQRLGTHSNRYPGRKNYGPN